MVSTDTPKSSAASFFVTSTSLAPPAAPGHCTGYDTRLQGAPAEKVSREVEQLWAPAPYSVCLAGRTKIHAVHGQAGLR